ncbi:hypothetical protein ACFX13_002781 [Malus domestica]
MWTLLSFVPSSSSVPYYPLHPHASPLPFTLKPQPVAIRHVPFEEQQKRQSSGGDRDEQELCAAMSSRAGGGSGGAAELKKRAETWSRKRSRA